MSLTSYRAALPRAIFVRVGVPRGLCGIVVVRGIVRFFPGLAVTYSPTS